jgi:hypothetical protein
MMAKLSQSGSAGKYSGPSKSATYFMPISLLENSSAYQNSGASGKLIEVNSIHPSHLDIHISITKLHKENKGSCLLMFCFSFIPDELMPMGKEIFPQAQWRISTSRRFSSHCLISLKFWFCVHVQFPSEVNSLTFWPKL